MSDRWLCWFQVQQLKSVNNLWSDWQLGVREFILVPVSSADERDPQNSADSLNNSAATGVAAASCELVTRQELSLGMKLPKSASVSGHIANNTASQPTSSVKQNSRESVEDYFSKYDSSLEKIKENVHRMEQTMKFVLFSFD